MNGQNQTHDSINLETRDYVQMNEVKKARKAGYDGDDDIVYIYHNEIFQDLHSYTLLHNQANDIWALARRSNEGRQRNGSSNPFVIKQAGQIEITEAENMDVEAIEDWFIDIFYEEKERLKNITGSRVYVWSPADGKYNFKFEIN